MCFGILTDGCAARFCKPVNKCELAGKKDGSDLTCPRMPLPGHRAGTTDTVLCPSSAASCFRNPLAPSGLQTNHITSYGRSRSSATLPYVP
jgi:hypothetical protein